MTTIPARQRPSDAGSADTAVRATAARRVGPGKAQSGDENDYGELSAIIRGMGLLGRRPAWYAARCLILVAGYVAGFAALFGLGSSPWQLLVAAYFAILFTQTAFLAHDGAHKQIFVEREIE